MRNNVCLTFDYELFFGAYTGSVQKCILAPVDQLLRLFKERKIVGTFFIDTLFLFRLSRQKVMSEEYKKLLDQMRNIVASGSRIELHLHPHWNDAIFENGVWKIPSYQHYTINSHSHSEIVDMFVSSTQFLNEIASEVETGYSCKAFRAGGFALLPFDSIREGFVKSGLSIDSSISGGMKIVNDSYTVLYPTVKRSFWRFDQDPLQPIADGPFIEIPISSKKVTVLDKVAGRIFKQDDGMPFGDGVGMVFKNNTLRKFSTIYNPYSLDKGSRLRIDDITSTNELITIIAHPKSMTSKSIMMIDALCDQNCGFLTLDEVVV
jgi:hypothetical protein